MNETVKSCRTCRWVNTCSIYKVARETQIQNVQPEQFGCMWHDEGPIGEVEPQRTAEESAR